jgi:hypothetical protein
MTSERRTYLVTAATEAQPYPPEADLARRWLEANIDDYDDIDWQKRVGVGVQLGADYTETMQAVAAQATRKRVDLVAYSTAGAVLIELKNHVDLAAIRQAANYAQLWAVAPATPPVAAVLVVGNTGDPEVAEIAVGFGVTVELIRA